MLKFLTLLLCVCACARAETPGEFVRRLRPQDASKFGEVEAFLEQNPEHQNTEMEAFLRQFRSHIPEPRVSWAQFSSVFHSSSSSTAQPPSTDGRDWVDQTFKRTRTPPPPPPPPPPTNDTKKNDTTVDPVDPPPPPPPPPPITERCWKNRYFSAQETCMGGTRETTDQVTTLPCKGRWRLCQPSKAVTKALVCTCHHGYFQLNQ